METINAQEGGYPQMQPNNVDNNIVVQMVPAPTAPGADSNQSNKDNSELSCTLRKQTVSTCLVIVQWILILYCAVLVSYIALSKQSNHVDVDADAAAATIKDHFVNNATISKMNSKITSLQNQIYLNDVDVSDLKSAINATVSDINTELSHLQNNIHQNDVDMLELKSVVNALESLGSLSTINMSNVNIINTNLQNQITENDADISAFQIQTNSNDADISALQIQTNSNDVDISALQTQTNSNDVDISDLQNQISSLTSRVSDLENSFSQTASGVIQMQSTVSHTKVTVNSIPWIEPSTDYRVSITPKYSDSKILISYFFGWNGYGIRVNTIVQWAAARKIGSGAMSVETISSAGATSGLRERISGVAQRRNNGYDGNDQNFAYWISYDYPATTQTVTYSLMCKRSEDESGYTGEIRIGESLYEQGGGGVIWGWSMPVTIIAMEIRN